MKFSLAFLFSFALLARNHASGLECYICDDCREVNNDMIDTCGAPHPTTLEPATTSAHTTITPIDTTSTSLRTNTTPFHKSTISFHTSTTPFHTSTTPFHTSTTPFNKALKTLVTTKRPSYTTSTSADKTSTISSLNKTISVPVITTTVASSEATASEPNATQGPAPKNGIPKADSILLRNYRSTMTRKRRATNNYYVCYKTTVDGKIKRGCAEIPVDKNACNVIEEDVGKSEHCVACENDRCNNGATAEISAVALLGMLLLNFIF